MKMWTRFAFVFSFMAVMHWSVEPMAQAKKVESDRAKEMRAALRETKFNPSGFHLADMKKDFTELFEKKEQHAVGLWFKMYDHVQMPASIVETVKGTKGEDVLRITFGKGKDSISMQLYGRSDLFVKIGSTEFSEADLNDFAYAVAKLSQDPLVLRFNKQFVREVVKKTDLRVSPQTFAKWTPQQRLNYFIGVRDVVVAAEKVQLAFAAQKGKKTSSIELENFLKMTPPSVMTAAHVVRGPAAYAEEPAPGESGVPEAEFGAVDVPSTLPDSPAGETAKPTTASETGSSSGTGSSGCTWKYVGPCVVAGFNSHYVCEGKRNFCSSEVAKKDPANRYAETIGDACGSSPNAVGCIPMLYGYVRSGAPKKTPFCLSASDPSFQTATAGECHTRSPLNTWAEKQAMLKSILEAQGTDTSKLFTDPNQSVIANAYKTQVQPALDAFDEFQKKALEACKNASKGEPNQDSACKTLQERQLNFTFSPCGGAEGGECPGGASCLGQAPPTPPTGSKDPVCDTSGGKTCTPAGTMCPINVGEKPSAVPGSAGSASGGGWASGAWNWIKEHKGMLIGFGLAIGAGILALLLWKKYKKRNGGNKGSGGGNPIANPLPPPFPGYPPPAPPTPGLPGAPGPPGARPGEGGVEGKDDGQAGGIR